MICSESIRMGARSLCCFAWCFCVTPALQRGGILLALRVSRRPSSADTGSFAAACTEYLPQRLQQRVDGVRGTWSRGARKDRAPRRLRGSQAHISQARRSMDSAGRMSRLGRGQKSWFPGYGSAECLFWEKSRYGYRPVTCKCTPAGQLLKRTLRLAVASARKCFPCSLTIQKIDSALAFRHAYRQDAPRTLSLSLPRRGRGKCV